MAVESVITVAPTMLRMKVGEIRQVQIITKYTNIKVTAEPSGVVEYDSIHREFKAVARGYVNIRFDAYDEKGDNVGYDYINASVSTETTKAPVRYMWHNRATNRLVTLTGNLNEDDNLIFKLPKKSGTLLTDTGMEIVSNNIVTPTILSPATGVTDYDGMITASPFELHIAIQTEKHIATTWQYSLVEDFSTILKEEYIYGTANNQLTTTSMSYYGITTYVRVKYHSKIGTSEYSKPIKITWTTDSPELNNNALVAGDVNTAAYFGSVDTATYIDNRDYRGNYLTLLNNNLKTCNQGAQVHLDDTLYYAKETLDATKFAKSPGSTDGATYWEVDARDSLPTVRWLMDRVGIGLGNTDNNLDTYTSDGTKIGEQINKDDNPWLKFIVNGKLIYTPAKSICSAISWCDVGKRNAVYGNRTVLIGTRLYRIRLLKEEEFTACFITLPDANADLKTLVTTDPVTDNNLIEDFREGANRYILAADGTKSEVKAGSRTCNYRPVLELIRPGDEPYQKIPKCAEAENENFRYDKYTDTGYFGFIKDTNQDIITNEELMVHMKYTNGTKLTTGLGYYKLYFHGLTFFMTTRPLRIGGTVLFLENLNLSYPVDMGKGIHLTVPKNDIYYIPSANNGIRVFPWSSTNQTNQAEDTMWGLTWRLVRPYVNTRGSGKQIGDNWEELETTTFITANSNEYIFQEIGVCDAASNSKTLINGNLGFSLASNIGIGDDCYPLILIVKNYTTE